MAGFLRSAVIRTSLGLRAGSPRAFGGANNFGACAARTSWGLLQTPESLPFARAYGLSLFAASGHAQDVRMFQTSTSLQSKKNRPLSPHLTVYRPEMSSMSSITNRITAGLVGVGIGGGIFVLKVADTSLSFYPVYSLVFFSQQIPYWLILSVGNFALLGVIYHVAHSLRRELQQWGIIKFKV